MKQIILYLASRVYLLLITMYNQIYNYQILTPFKSSVPLVSIGNVAMGGTGKTPITICLSKLLNSQSIKHVIISRGYKKNSRGTVLVSDGKHNVSDFVDSAYESGDEAYLMASKLPNTPIVVDNNKINAIKYAIKNFHPDIILIDDAFQSRYLNIDYNIVLHNDTSLDCDMKMFPLGRLRQPLSSLQRADTIIITKSKHKLKPVFLNQYKEIIMFSKSTTFILEWRHKSQFLVKKPSQKINTAKIFIFCGLADPSSFFQSAQQHYSNLYMKKSYSDHYEYQNKIGFLQHCKLAEQQQITTFVTSYKDFVKIYQDNNIMSKNVIWEIIDIEYSLSKSILKKISLK